MDQLTLNVAKALYEKYPQNEVPLQSLPEDHPLWAMAFAAVAACRQAQQGVAVVGDVFTLYWAGSGSIAPLINAHNIKVGDSLFVRL